MKKRMGRGSSRPRADAYRSIFLHSRVSLQIEDISELRAIIQGWRACGITDIRAHLERHPRVLREAVRSVEVVDVNDMTLQLYEAAGRQELLGPLRCEAETIPEAIELITAIAEGRHELEYESTTRTLRGRKLDIMTRMYFPAEEEYYALVSVIDISERMRLDRKLTQERALLRAVIDNIPDQVFLKDKEGRFLVVNEALARWAGAADPGVLVGKSDLDYFPRDVAEKFRGDDQAIITSGTARVNIEEQISSASGSQGWALTTKAPVRDTTGHVFGLVGIVRDITERKRLERALAEERAQLRAVLNVLPDAIFLKDTESRFILANQALADLMGVRSAAELIGGTDRDFYPEEMAGEFLSDEREIIQKGRPLINKEEPKQVGGATRWIVVSKLPVRDNEGRITGLVGTSRDFTERKKSEQALKATEERYRAIFMDAPVGIFHSTPEGKLISVNPAYARMMGYDSPEQIIEIVNRKNAAEVLYEDPQRRADLVDMLVQGPSWHGIESRQRRRDGGVVVVQLTIRLHVPPGAKEPELEGFVEDITDRRRVEQELSRERAFLTALMDNIPDYIYFKDRESRFILNNKAHARGLGAGSPAEMRGKTDFDYFAPQHAQKAFDDEQRIIRTGQPLVNDVEEQKWPSRPSTWATATKMPLRDEKGEIIGTFGVSRDMTERRQMEQKNLRLAAMIESSNDAIIGVDLDDSVMSWNKGAERIFGLTAEEMLRKPITELLSSDAPDQAPWSVPSESPTPRGSVRQFESSVTRKDGTTVHVSTTFSPIQDENGLIIGITSISRDVTDQRALQTQIIRSQRLESLGTLSAGIAHQFNNINAVTQGYLDIMAQDAALPSSALRYVQKALKAVHRAVEITERLQGLTSAPALGAETIRLEDEMPALLPLVEGTLKAERIELQIDFQETAPVRAARQTLSFIVTSLLTNSIHALLDCPSRLITVRTRRGAGFSALEVSDTGCGIAPENLPRIFTPFFTTKGEWAEPDSPQSRVKGIGLSLAVCQSTISESGGRIEVESVPQQGSTFRVWFPAAGG